MSMNKKDRCLFGNKEEQLRIYNQRRTINRLEQQNQKYKEVIDKAIEYNKKNIHSQTLYKILKEE